MTTATLTFQKRIQAEEFSIAWTRFTRTGHTVWAWLENVVVSVSDIDEGKKSFIDNYINNLNK